MVFLSTEYVVFKIICTFFIKGNSPLSRHVLVSLANIVFAISLHENVQLSLQTVFAYIRLFFFRNIQNCFDSRNKMYSANYINSSHHNVIQGDGIFLI